MTFAHVYNEIQKSGLHELNFDCYEQCYVCHYRHITIRQPTTSLLLCFY